MLFFISFINYVISINSLASSALNFWCFGWLIFISIFIYRDKKIGWLFFLYLFGLTASLASCLIIEETQYYLTEIESYGFLTGATSRSSSLGSIFIVSVYIFFGLFQKIYSGRLCFIAELKDWEDKLLKLALIFITMYLYFSLFQSPPPIFSNLSRFNYFQDGALPGYRFFYTLIPFSSLILSSSYLQGRISKKTIIFWVIAMIGIMLLTNEKFSLYVDTFYYLITPFIIWGKITIDRKFHVMLGAFLLFLISLVLVSYLRRGEELSYLFSRIALQGQMIFALDLISLQREGFDFDLLSNSFLGFSSNSGDIGMYHLMHLIAPTNVVDEMISTNMSFTAPFPSSFSYFFTNYYAPIAIILFAVPVSYSIFVFYKTLLSSSLFNIFIAATLFHYLSIATFMGKTERLVHPITISAFLITVTLLVCGFLKKSGNS